MLHAPKLAAAIVLAILCTGASSAADAPPPAGLPRFAQINEHLYRGAQPSPAGLKSLNKLGVHAVIDLRGGGERSGVEEKEVGALGMKYYSIPLHALSAPTDKQISTIL